jgi:uncharacterized protein (DUF362 family)
MKANTGDESRRGRTERLLPEKADAPVDPRRRRALRMILGGITGLAWASRDAAGESAPAKSATSEATGAPVARARREGLLGPGDKPDPEKLDGALGSAVAKAAGEDGPVAAMRRLFRPGDVVGIKVNSLAGRGLSPHPALVNRLTGWLQEAGVPARNIVIWDRTDRELAAAGFSIVRRGNNVRCFGTNDDYDWSPREWGPGGSCFARLLVDDLTALINVGVLKDHDLAGVSIGLKNWYGVIHNPNKHHDNGCNPYVAHLAAYPLIRDKLRLTVIDGMSAQCHGGPARNPRWIWPWQGLLVSTDPVAVDAVGRKIIDERRAALGLPSVAEAKREPEYIETAGNLGLGIADPTKVKVEDV